MSTEKEYDYSMIRNCVHDCVESSPRATIVALGNVLMEKYPGDKAAIATAFGELRFELGDILDKEVI